MFVHRTHTSNFGVYQLLSINYVWKALTHECKLICSRVRTLLPYQEANAQFLCLRHTLEIFVRRMHTPNFGVYQLLSITSVC